MLLCYVDDQIPGISRRKRGKTWHYFSPEGVRITDPEEVARLNRLGVPPAYKDVWFCPDPNGHLQATGIDARGRKQYRYHDEYRAFRDAHKYDRCVHFGHALPKLREKVAADIELPGLGRDRILAAVVRLLDIGYLRVGNEGYAQENDSYGATTLRNEHGRVWGDKVRLEYRGKGGQVQKVEIRDKILARIVRRCQDLPGQHLFQYVDDDGQPHPIGSSDVNDYIREAMGEEFSAKHFRTWGASVLAFETIVRSDPDEPITIKQLLEPVAQALGNTPAISRKSYVHPLLIEAVKRGDIDKLVGRSLPRPMKYLAPEERGFLEFLEEAEPEARRAESTQVAA